MINPLTHVARSRAGRVVITVAVGLFIVVVSLGMANLGGDFMAHGQPDYLQASSTQIVSGVSDLGELAARVGSIDTFDRRGNVIFIDGFERGLIPYAWNVNSTNGYIELNQQTSYSGAWAAHLNTGTGGAQAILLLKALGVARATRQGFEVSFYEIGGTPFIAWTINYFDGAHSNSWQIFYDYSTNLLKYRGADGLTHVFGSPVVLIGQDLAFHTGKLVVDLQTGRYVRFILDQVSYDLSNFSCLVGVNPQATEVTTSWQITSSGGVIADAWLDNWIITINEP